MLHFSPLLHVTTQRLDNRSACFTFHCLSANKTECHADAKRMWLGGLEGKCVTRKSLCKGVNVCMIFFWQVDDVIVSRLGTCTEEGKKVQRNGGKNFLAVFRRIEDPNKDWAFWTRDAAVLLPCRFSPRIRADKQEFTCWTGRWIEYFLLLSFLHLCSDLTCKVFVVFFVVFLFFIW